MFTLIGLSLLTQATMVCVIVDRQTDGRTSPALNNNGVYND